jgi:hypothetical protein
LSREESSHKVVKILIKFNILVSVLPMDEKILELALAIQYHTALENHLDIIISGKKKILRVLLFLC